MTICRWTSRERPRSAILELSAGDIQAAFRKWIRPGDFVQVTVGPPAE